MSLPALKSIRTALHALNPKDVRELSEKPVHVALQASSDAAYQRMEAFFLQELRPGRREASASLLTRGLNSSPLGNAAEIVVYDTGSLVPTDALVLDFEHPVRFVHETLKRYPDAGVSLARSFYPFRKPFVHSVISKTARENTLFSITTALPDIIPSLIELPWAIAEFASDTAFLTMNQVRMAFLIAAASDRPVGYMEQKSEIATVIGSAFGWRALARQVIGKVPFGGGLIGKAAVAYAGTKVLGLSLEQFYSIGFTYTREERDRLYTDAFHQGKRIATKILSYARPDLMAKFAGRGKTEGSSVAS
jgi:GNAT superfamily N-acetyltransferase